MKPPAALRALAVLAVDQRRRGHHEALRTTYALADELLDEALLERATAEPTGPASPFLASGRCH